MPFFSRIFWGLLLLLLGCILIVNNVYGLDLPVWGIFWPLIIIVLGFSLLFPHRTHWHDWQHQAHDEGTVLFDDQPLHGSSDRREYNVIFGRSVVDLRKMKIGEKDLAVEVSAIFGTAKILVDEDVPLRVKASTVLGGMRLPDGQAPGLGDHYYDNKKEGPALCLKVNVVFGEAEVVTAKKA